MSTCSCSSLLPTLSQELSNSSRGGSSKIIRKEFPELEEFLWGDSLWTDGYFAETVGRANEDIIRRYIKAQWSQPQNSSRGL